jgi:hypothetical protein
MNSKSLLLMTACLLIPFAMGCGDGKLRPKGYLIKDGGRFVPNEGRLIQVTFVPIPSNGEPVRDHYYADVDQTTGTFIPAGKDGRGMPAGKYRVAVQIINKRSDELKGKFDQEKSPFVFDVDSNSNEFVLDLDKPPQFEKQNANGNS